MGISKHYKGDWMAGFVLGSRENCEQCNKCNGRDTPNLLTMLGNDVVPKCSRMEHDLE
jgi:hypothetical protein